MEVNRMEPMSLGSPIGSPTNSNPTATQSTGYLPGYLMGDLSSQVCSTSNNICCTTLVHFTVSLSLSLFKVSGRSFQTSPMKMAKTPVISYMSASPPQAHTGMLAAPGITPKTHR